MTETHKYKNPPLIEAVFELFFTTKQWNSVIPGLFYTKIQDKFPNISQNNGFGITFDGQGLKVGGGSNELAQYKSHDNTSIIQLSSNMLIVNKLPKYEGWEKFLETIIFAIHALEQVLPIDNIDRIGLRFVNKIDIGEHSLSRLKDFLTVFPVYPFEQTIDFNAIQLNLESPLIPNTEILAILLATIKEEPNYKAPIIFQLYQTRISDMPQDYETWLDEAHTSLYTIFEQSITKSLKMKLDYDS